MDIKQIILVFFRTILKIVIAGCLVFAIYKIALWSYDFGFKVFQDKAMMQEPGIDVTVTLEPDSSPMEIGEILERQGLIEDAKVFYAQEFLSENKGKLKAGVYVLNTSMRAREMMAMMAADSAEEEQAALDENQAGETSQNSVSGNSVVSMNELGNED